MRYAFMRTYYVSLHICYIALPIGLGVIESQPIIALSGKTKFHALRAAGSRQVEFISYLADLVFCVLAEGQDESG